MSSPFKKMKLVSLDKKDDKESDHLTQESDQQSKVFEIDERVGKILKSNLDEEIKIEIIKSLIEPQSNRPKQIDKKPMKKKSRSKSSPRSMKLDNKLNNLDFDLNIFKKYKWNKY